ncbi:MAG: hypothetical protein ACTTHG_01345 [Treponemataceae bacterium]
MASQYYLMSQLPAFSITQSNPLPVTEEYFIDLCSRFMNKDCVKLMKELSLTPPQKETICTSKLVNQYYDFERKLRIALAQMRAQKMKKDFEDEYVLFPQVPGDVMSIARNAIAMESPLDAEDYLNKSRADFICKIQPIDNFSDDAVFAYALKLKLAMRIKKFNKEAGMASYRKIYDTILGEST